MATGSSAEKIELELFDPVFNVAALSVSFVHLFRAGLLVAGNDEARIDETGFGLGFDNHPARLAPTFGLMTPLIKYTIAARVEASPSSRFHLRPECLIAHRLSGLNGKQVSDVHPFTPIDQSAVSKPAVAAHRDLDLWKARSKDADSLAQKGHHALG